MIAWIFLALMLYIAWKYLLEEDMMISVIQNKYDYYWIIYI
jgi:hypothetical protein